MLPLPSRCLPACALALGLCAPDSRAIIVYASFPSLTLVEGPGPGGGAAEPVLLVAVGESGPHRALEAGPLGAGGTLAPAGGMMAEFDVRHLRSYVIPVTFDFFDASRWEGSIDVAPGPGPAHTVMYDLEAGIAVEGRAEGDGPGPRARLDYRISSEPFRYDYSLMDHVWQDPEGLWHYEYGIGNGFYSTFDLESLTIPGLGTRHVGLGIWGSPDYVYEPIITTRAPITASATLEWGDLRRTRTVVPVRIPEPVEAVPEPSSAALLAGGLLGMLWLRARGGKRLPRSGRRGS